MFGIWFGKQLYEVIPPIEFATGIVLLILGFSPLAPLASLLLAFAGLVLTATALYTIHLRISHRGSRFHFYQLLAPIRPVRIQRRLSVPPQQNVEALIKALSQEGSEDWVRFV